MTKETYYVYLGTNGTITSPVHLEDIYYTIRYHLIADEGMRLTKNGKDLVHTTVVAEDELKEWYEVPKKV